MTITADPQYGELQAKLDDPEELTRLAKSGKLASMMQDLMDKKSKTIQAEEQQYIRDQVDLGIQEQPRIG